MLSAYDRQKLEAVIRRGVRLGFCTTQQAPLAKLAATADDVLVDVLHNKQHVLHQLLPNRTIPIYNLCSRKHDCLLPLLLLYVIQGHLLTTRYSLYFILFLHCV